MLHSTLLGCIAALSFASASPTSYQVNDHSYKVDNIITRDVAIIGGGSSGTYAAIRLHDLGKSIALIEKIGRLGGNTQTYHDPISGATVDYGVRVWHPIQTTIDYFTRLGVSYLLTSNGAGGASLPTEYLDFTTGKLNTTFTPPDFTTALGTYYYLASQYPYLEYGWTLPSPVPSDLLLPFGTFVKNYGLESAVNFIWTLTQGLGDILTIPTVYVLKNLGTGVIDAFTKGFLTTSAGDNSLIYESATTILGADVFLNTNVLAVERTSKKGVKLILQGSDGKITLLTAKELIMAIQPTIANLKFLDLTDSERDLFQKWKWTEYFTGILLDTGLPGSSFYQNIDITQPYAIPKIPSVYMIEQTYLPYVQIATWVSETGPYTEAEVEAQIVADFKKFQIPGLDKTKTPTFAEGSIHQPFELRVGSKDIKDGFYEKLVGLQGKKETWWVSATWHSHDSSLIWRYIDSLLGGITAGL